ncbi:MAG: PAS domain S-box protein, partial [Candidatus Electryonea clarkiae]|nr:PAS domain S-box protein [Candidatus Electryonea clarkiae]
GVHGKVALTGEEVRFEQYQEQLKRWYSVYLYSPKKEYFVSIFSDITDQKQAEEALRQSEDHLRLKLDTILLPDVDIEDFELSNIIDVQELQSLMVAFFKITEMPVSILDLKGNVLAATRWQDICKQFHRVHPETCAACTESDLYFTESLMPGEFVTYECNNHLWDMATPLMLGDKHVGNIYTGQFFYDDKVVDRQVFIDMVEKYGFDKESYLAALDRVPRISRARAKSMMEYLVKFSKMISKLSFSNVKLAKAVCERKQAEKEIRKLSKVFLDGTVPTIIEDLDGIVIEMNEEAVKAYDYTREELIGKPIKLLVPDEKHKQADELLKLCRSGELIRNVEGFRQKKDGSIIPVLISLSLLTDEEDKPIGIASIALDITDRKLDEEQIKAKSIFMESLIQQSPLPTFVMDSKGFNVMVNKAFLKFYAVPDKDMIIGSNALSDPANVSQGVVKYFKEALKGKIVETPDIEFVSPHENKKVITRCKMFPILDPTDTLTNVVVIQEDITERKQAEKKLKESEGKYRMLVENLQQKIFIKDVNSKYISVNDNYAEDLGLTPEDIIGKNDYDFHPTELADKYISDDKKVMETGKTKDSEEQAIISGKKYWMQTIKSAVRNESGDIVGLQGISYDISDRKRDELELKKHQEHLEEIVEERTHDLKKTINLMAGREVRMAELKVAIKSLRAQVEDAGMIPVADDPLKEQKSL